MEYKLYTLVDITHTGQYRNEPGKEQQRWQEQNFNTLMQTMGIRGNIFYRHNPEVITTAGKTVGFDTDKLVTVWRFDFYTEQDHMFEDNGNPVAVLKELFNGVPYISGLNESVQQNYDIFVTDGPSRNIVFYEK